jgi:hypothetical protein
MFWLFVTVMHLVSPCPTCTSAASWHACYWSRQPCSSSHPALLPGLQYAPFSPFHHRRSPPRGRESFSRADPFIIVSILARHLLCNSRFLYAQVLGASLAHLRLFVSRCLSLYCVYCPHSLRVLTPTTVVQPQPPSDNVNRPQAWSSASRPNLCRLSSCVWPQSAGSSSCIVWEGKSTGIECLDSFT